MKNLVILLTCVFALNAFAQDNKTVTLIVSGQGKTQEEAKLNALRGAIEQAFGAFISSKTEILNDRLIKDEIISLSNDDNIIWKIEDYYKSSNNQWDAFSFSVVITLLSQIMKETNERRRIY
jgi:hypothetical protein